METWQKMNMRHHMLRHRSPAIESQHSPQSGPFDLDGFGLSIWCPNVCLVEHPAHVSEFVFSCINVCCYL